MRKTSKGIKKITVSKSCITGVTVGLLSAVLFVSIGVLCINNEYITLNNMGIVAAFIQFISIMMASITAGKITSDKPIVCCAAVAGICFLIFIGVAISFFDGISGALLSGIITTGIGFLVSLFIIKGGKNHTGRKKNKIRSR